GLDTGGVAVHHQTYGAGRGEQAGLRVSPSVLLADLVALCPHLGREVVDRPIHLADEPDGFVGGRVLAHYPGMRLGVAGKAVVRTHDTGQFGRPLVRGAGHQRGDGGGDRPPTVRVV